MDEKLVGEAGARFEIYPDFAGRFRWRLRDDNLEVAADSARSFRSYRDAHGAAKRAKWLAQHAELEGNGASMENVRDRG